MPTASTGLTLLDIAKSHESVASPLVELVIVNTPELMAAPVRTVDGTTYQTLNRVGLPSVGFSKVNKGFAPSKSRTELTSFECLPFGGRVEADARLARQWKGGEAAYFAFEAQGMLLATMQALGTQMFYGAGGATDDGFPGLKQFVPVASTFSVDATGTTALTASSVYFVKWGVDDGVALIAGMDGDIYSLREPRIESLTDKDGTNKFDGLVSQMDGWVGLQIANANCVGRIYNLTADSGKGLTDALGYSLLEKFPVGWKPDVALMSRRSLGQLQRSRTVVTNNSSGPLTYGGLPTEIAGVPIIVTDSILNTDAIGS